MTLPIVLSLGHRFADLTIAESILEGIADVIDGNNLDDKQLEKFLSITSAIMLGTRSELRADRLRRMHRCLLIVRYGVGVDNVDIYEAFNRGILVANVPNYCIEEVSDHTVALILAANRRLILANHETLKGNWNNAVMNGVVRLSLQTVGLIGFGRISSSVVRKIKALVKYILVYDPFVDPKVMVEAGVNSVDLDTLLHSSDYVSVHCPLTPDTYHLINQETLSKTRSSSWIINTSRGEIIDEIALFKALKDGKIGGAALDVLSSEPPSPNFFLYDAPNLILTPHVAYYSLNAIEDLQRIAAEQVRDMLLGKEPIWLVKIDGQ